MGKRQAVLLQQLEEMRRCHGPGCSAPCERLLASLRGAQIPDVESLIRFHDTLLFLRAFPQSVKVARLAEELLHSLEPQVERLCKSPADIEAFDDERVSGIAGTTVTNSWTFELARWLENRHPRHVNAEWNVEERSRQMATVLPSCLPLLEDDSFVEADTPFVKWMEAAAGGKTGELNWLLNGVASLPVSTLQRTNLYDSLGIDVRWSLSGSSASRTLARRPVSRVYVHKEPLIQRKQVSLLDEMQSGNIDLRKLSTDGGQSAIDMARDALAVRYRELQGSTYGDPAQAFQADVGRGVQLFLWGLHAEWRLPLRAYYAGLTLKNGVPVNYFEAIGLFEWMEVGFNTFYAFREGETAWIYSKILHVLHQVAGITCFAVYPYQIGNDNDEAIQSGAFWFYRKLGFRPGRPDLLAVTEREERKMARDLKHRTSPRTLRKLAEGHMFFEFGASEPGQWDSFSTRTLGLAVQRKMAAQFDGKAESMRRTRVARLSDVLGFNLKRWSAGERWALENFALALAVVPGVARWTRVDKHSLVAVIRAKAGPSETQYLRLLQKHHVLREAFLAAGSERSAEPPP